MDSDLMKSIWLFFVMGGVTTYLATTHKSVKSLRLAAVYGFGGWGVLLYLVHNWSEIQNGIGDQWKYVGGPFFLLGILLIYFMPWVVATTRSHRESTPILLVNLFLGWTFIGWVAALIWSTTSNVKVAAPKL